ncbi:hypothetical protein EXU30_00305 [Shewanella maritima]|uniref:DUF2523 domain-containing protein n=1 Tax=Shewanella maritima TaxID=2520507 RepID=A0A411PCL5_9GAMM|nr:DUF5455 family protein [Shewanella maritima]QBF81275.1 hypothetical protein EXU30_00125 [Shewanella maritima]QBF81284.1 hypothetical protein EXU30_00170 [Shewanella maritima]QBF81293.1 hypothetical protein EXU30_00215 [Shewanella maritima]QBF81302.1 hypothetical protein EXU30_00260 [Shewanella maritima]QBF81311.1 hypothetical protein EXU30_00305 [Shewanella maritima]
MPLPAIIGLPALATMIGGFVTSAVTWILSKVTVKVGVILAALAVMATATAAVVLAFSTALNAAINGMSADVMTGLYFLPSNINHCIGLVVGFHASLITYDMTMKVVGLKIEIAK